MERIELKPGTDVLITGPSQGLKDAPATIKSVGAVYHAVTKQVEFSIVYDTGLKTHEVGYFKDLGLDVKPLEIVKLDELKVGMILDYNGGRGIVVEVTSSSVGIQWFDHNYAYSSRRYYSTSFRDARIVGKVDLWKV